MLIVEFETQKLASGDILVKGSDGLKIFQVPIFLPEEEPVEEAITKAKKILYRTFSYYDS